MMKKEANKVHAKVRHALGLEKLGKAMERLGAVAVDETETNLKVCSWNCRTA